MVVWSAFPVFILSILAIGPDRDMLSPTIQNPAQLGTVLSLFVLVCALEAGNPSRCKDPV
jgi:hypothetical protein